MMTFWESWMVYGSNAAGRAMLPLYVEHVEACKHQGIREYGFGYDEGEWGNQSHMAVPERAIG